MIKRKRTYAPKIQKKKPKASYRKPVSSAITKISPTGGLPTRQFATLVYCEKDINIPGGLAGLSGTYSFRADLFDPNFSGSGHQPGGFDELMALYEKYCVYECEYKVIFVATTSNQPMIVNVRVDDSPVSTTNMPLSIEQGNSQFSVLPTTNGSGYKELTGKIDLAKMHGVSRTSLFSDDTFWGSDTAAATDGIYIHLEAANPISENGTNVEFIIELRMKAVFQGSRLFNQS